MDAPRDTIGKLVYVSSLLLADSGRKTNVYHVQAPTPSQTSMMKVEFLRLTPRA